MSIFNSADILLPKKEFHKKWPVIACDQFTSEPEYWEEAYRLTDGAPTALSLILPEAELPCDLQERAAQINGKMEQFLENNVFYRYPDCYIYVERILSDGQLRTGIVGTVDLERYDYSENSKAAVRATEKTVVERIPPRVTIRRGAPLELPHILLLCNDETDSLMNSIRFLKEELPVVYDIDLMQGSGHITGYLVRGEAKDVFEKAKTAYENSCEIFAERLGRRPMFYAVGDGNHSLATAKACYEELKQNNAGAISSPARYALTELGNIYEASLHFEAIHRIITETLPEELLKAIESEICADNGIPVRCCYGGREKIINLDLKRGTLAVAILQKWLDDNLSRFGGKVDYIHDDESAVRLSSAKGAIAFILPAMEKDQLFTGIVKDGVLPRKTFSMGHARDKRFYMEARKIRAD